MKVKCEWKAMNEGEKAYQRGPTGRCIEVQEIIYDCQAADDILLCVY